MIGSNDTYASYKLLTLLRFGWFSSVAKKVASRDSTTRTARILRTLRALDITRLIRFVVAQIVRNSIVYLRILKFSGSSDGCESYWRKRSFLTL